MAPAARRNDVSVAYLFLTKFEPFEKGTVQLGIKRQGSLKLTSI
jgi:hypothetical protein